MNSRFRAVRLAALAIGLSIAATLALAGTSNAQEPGEKACHLSDLVLLGASPADTSDTPPIADVAFPGEACMFLEASFANVFDLGGGLTPLVGGVPGEYTGGCDLADIIDAVVMDVPELAEAMGVVPDVALSEEACEALRLTYGLLASGSLTPLAASALGGPSVPPMVTPIDVPEETMPAPEDETAGEGPVSEEPADSEPDESADEPVTDETSTPEAVETPAGDMVEAEGSPAP
jgi:hypothetical protein